MPPSPRFLGVTTLSPFFQVEGVEPVLDRLQAAGVPQQHGGKDGEQGGNDDTGAIDAARR